MTTRGRWSTSQDKVRCIIQTDPAYEFVAEYESALRLAKFVRRAKLAVHEMEVEVTHSTGEADLLLMLAIRVHGRLAGGQPQQLLQTADRCVMHRALDGKICVIQLESLPRA